jgi:hypothetical protein
MITIQQIPLEKIRGKRILVLIDPNIEKAAPTIGSLIGKSAKLVMTLNAGRDELISFLQRQYGFGRRRAASEADDFIEHVQNRVRLATEISTHPKSNAA